MSSSRLAYRLATTSRQAVRAFAVARVQARHAHNLRALEYPIEGGLGDFLPPNALKTVAVDWQQGLLQRLSDEVKDTEQEGQTVAQTVVGLAGDRSRILAFNYASQALNNSFFLDSLKPPSAEHETYEQSLSSHLKSYIVNEFGSVENLKQTFSAAALGMSSSGWVWLVTDKFGHLAVVPTFGAGTMLVAGRRQMWYGSQGTLVASEPIPSLIRESEESVNRTASPTAPLGSAFSPTSPVSGSSSTNSTFQPPTQSRSMHTSHRLGYDNLGGLTSAPSSLGDAGRHPVPRLGFDLNKSRVGDMVYPLFCVSVHEHAWVSHRGVWGKEQYLKDFWKVLDWHKVSTLFEKWVANRTTM